MQSASRTHKILVVDDNHDAANTTGDLLRWQGGYDVRVAYDGLQAVEEARLFCPEVVVLDINMPVMNGYEAAIARKVAVDSGRRSTSQSPDGILYEFVRLKDATLARCP